MHQEWLENWAKSGSSSWGSERVDGNTYVALPTPKEQQYLGSQDSIQICKTFLHKITRNATCFNKCKALNMRTDT